MPVLLNAKILAPLVVEGLMEMDLHGVSLLYCDH